MTHQYELPDDVKASILHDMADATRPGERARRARVLVEAFERFPQPCMHCGKLKSEHVGVHAECPEGDNGETA